MSIPHPLGLHSVFHRPQSQHHPQTLITSSPITAPPFGSLILPSGVNTHEWPSQEPGDSPRLPQLVSHASHWVPLILLPLSWESSVLFLPLFQPKPLSLTPKNSLKMGLLSATLIHPPIRMVFKMQIWSFHFLLKIFHSLSTAFKDNPLIFSRTNVVFHDLALPHFWVFLSSTPHLDFMLMTQIFWKFLSRPLYIDHYKLKFSINL